MTDRASAEDWFRRYRVAWESNDVDDIRSLFTEDAIYRGFPDDPAPYVGLDAIVAGWLENADQPGDTDFEWKLLAVDGEVAIAECVTAYVNSNPPRVYDNLFVITLPAGGRATEFTDWWIERTPEEAA
ncbi:nuclear transport factor 2 family protein [Pseudolysinimonas sp.]|jgi:ketosteroid isomerase-like protein|uniref:nuclear transport factor 2 family protein n=1 Tax=Pseudolysinimonas sp. TaxID=2680009 RepID=UPI003783FAB7